MCLGEKEAAKRQLVTECHEWLCAHNGVDRTLAILTQNYSRDMAAEAWPNLRNDVSKYVLSGATGQKMDERHTSGDKITLRESHQLRYVLFFIDTFTRYVELFPTKNVTAEEATGALWLHRCRFGTLIEITTDCGSQFLNATLEGYATLSGVRHLLPYHTQRRKIGSSRERMKSQPPHLEHFIIP